MLTYCLLVTGPAYGTQQASSALLFARALLKEGHRIDSVFFYREGVLNANYLTSPANDEYDLIGAWVALSQQYDIALKVCVSAALRRGIIDEREAAQYGHAVSNLQTGFTLSGLGALAEAALCCDRLIQF